MSGTIRNFYAGGNTANGFVSLFDSSSQGLERLIILQGVAGSGKLANLRSLGNQMAEEGHEIWFIHCASDNDSLDGLIIPNLKIGIIDGSAPHIVEPKLNHVAYYYVNLGGACDQTQLDNQSSVIEQLQREITQAYERAYVGFAEALRIHDEWEVIYIANMNFQVADELTQEYIHLLYDNRTLKKQSRIDDRFLGAATPKGAVDFVPDLTEGLKRYLIKGRPGSGKSTMLKKLASVGIERGFDVEIYHCGFDSNSLDMIIVRELGFAIFDSTAPHEYYPDRPTDEIVDMYERCIQPGTDEAHSDTINSIKERYSTQMKQSSQHLAQARAHLDDLERIYVQSMDLRMVERIKGEIQQELTRVVAKL